ncbi:putative integral membrane protein (TIGR00698 family) [Yimella lutea]|uniref:Putative integral membrane protein (TIGR00698 family) n=1 Tax=Yimella lutea TaxID=587872 RepID=A0A542EJ02_9MICO|nr:putative sulfate exporter family transporter [Yimella lutea]TQJ15196.1 putative integral membrane protein (TIGR00698 family) [Yimella lutea]
MLHAAPTRTSRRGLVAGLAVVLLIGCVATVFGQFAPVLGGPVCGIVLGLAAGVAVPRLRSHHLDGGYEVCSKQVLQASVVVLGTGLSLRQVAQVGSSSLPVMLASLSVALGGAALIGRWLRVGRDVRTLIGVGTGICGASAIAASTAVMRPKKADAAYALGTIFVFNVIGVLTFPVIGHLLGMTGESFGLWAGTAINDTSSVVAAAYGFGDGAGDQAIVVKLTRSLMIIPITIVLAYLTARRAASSSPGGPSTVRIPLRQVVPWFLVGFVVAAAVNSIGVIPTVWHPGLSRIGTFGITLALTAIGLSMRPAQLRRTGLRPLLLGAILSVLVASTSLAMQALTGTL